ncbi:GNAT family N-acetyltransferase [Tsuneonella mangrovi]|uniref:GNAT family N-acetyltransferase n=1 Tax=Tsuneonella mangrovi TaxID=1982042 RepID=UPI000BA2340D|nr:GNAT family N-acetyltransferase [Tsuneonella mangrovi]
MSVTFRPATIDDLSALHPVIERAYRGDTARQGWTHEADLLDDTRTDRAELEAIVSDPEQVLLMAEEDGVPIGSVNVVRRSAEVAYLGLLCIEPLRQAGGLGRQLIAAAEEYARSTFGCTTMEMTVLEQRTELIEYYLRRGYQRTGERRDFPVPLDPPYFMAVLAKSLV